MKKLFLSVLGSQLFILLSAQTGKVGINTTTPKAMLHVKDSSVLFSGASDINPTPGDLPDSLTGVRMLWYPDKAAFRVGRASNSSWRKDNIGTYSFAAGYQPRAEGQRSVAMGSNSIATGTGAFAMGDLAFASGDHSVAMGKSTDATGQNSFAIGDGSLASGNYSVAMGRGNTASGQYSLSMGYFTSATSEGAVVFGYDSHTSGTNAMAIGYACYASGSGSFSFGDVCRSHGSFSFSGGRSSQATGSSSVALGDDCLAVGNYSTSIGKTTYSKSYNSFVVGSYNDTTSSSSTAWVGSDPLFIVGNGAIGDLSNAVTVLKNSKTGINLPNPQAALHIKGLDATENRHIRLESNGSSAYASIYYGGDLFIKNNNNGGDFYFRDHLNNNVLSLFSTGNMTIAGVLTQNSDARLKKNIQPIGSSLGKILRIHGYHYQWIAPQRDPGFQTGLLAQEIEKIMPELVLTDEKGIKSVSYTGLIPYMVEAFKEQQGRIDKLEKELSDLKKLLRSN